MKFKSQQQKSTTKPKFYKKKEKLKCVLRETIAIAITYIKKKKVKKTRAVWCLVFGVSN